MLVFLLGKVVFCNFTFQTGESLDAIRIVDNKTEHQ